MPCGGFSDAIFHMNVTNPLGKMRPRFTWGFAAESPSVMGVPDDTTGSRNRANNSQQGPDAEKASCVSSNNSTRQPRCRCSCCHHATDPAALIVIRFGQRLSPSAAAKSADVSRAPRIGPIAKRQHFSPGLLIVADEFEEESATRNWMLCFASKTAARYGGQPAFHPHCGRSMRPSTARISSSRRPNSLRSLQICGNRNSGQPRLEMPHDKPPALTGTVINLQCHNGI